MTHSDNDARAFWQSRMTKAGSLAPYPDLVDLHAGARSVRLTYPTGSDRIALHLIFAPLATRMALNCATP